MPGGDVGEIATGGRPSESVHTSDSLGLHRRRVAAGEGSGLSDNARAGLSLAFETLYEKGAAVL